MRVTVFDYGAGNLHSLTKALASPGVDVRVEPDPARSTETDLLVLPGVGAFAQAATRLAPAREVVRDRIQAGLPTLGICLGMQLLFERSAEGPGEGLGVIAGDVERLRAHRVPQIGWNALCDVTDPIVTENALTNVYYANSYVCRPTDLAVVSAWTRHDDDRFPAIVRSRSVVGVQFHPEKSSAAGVRFLRAVVFALHKANVESRGPRAECRELAGESREPRAGVRA